MKMVRLSRAMLAIFVILTSNQDSLAIEQDWITKADEIILNEGDSLVIKCTSPKYVFLIYPDAKNDSDSGIVTSTYNISKEINNGYHTHTFRRDKTIHGDTGLYGCPDSYLEVISHPLFRTDHNLVYIYIRSSTSVFVADRYNFVQSLFAKTVTLPCRPTSPDITVHLLFEGVPKYLDFNPRIGFTVKNFMDQHMGHYQCIFTADNTTYRVNYFLRDKLMANTPEILGPTPEYVTRGQTLRINCTVRVLQAYLLGPLDWTVPQPSARITKYRYTNKISRIFHDLTIELILTNATYEDEGIYECRLRTIFSFPKAEKFIEIHDPDNSFMNITAQVADRHYERREGDKVQWIVYISSYPPPRIEWFNPKNEEITGPWDGREKYAVKVTLNETVVRINNLTIYDTGEYCLRVTNENAMEMLNFTLDVSGKPVLKMERYYNFNTTANISCDVAAFSEPNITWSFVECPSFPICKSSETIKLMKTKISGTNTIFRSTVTMTIETSGYLTCSECNVFECNSRTAFLLVTDGVNDFGIIGPKNEVIEGDDVELICAASVYNYTNKFEWKYTNGTSVQENDRMTIYSVKTPFTYRSALKIENATKADSMNYTCVNKEEMDYSLEVEVARPPYFIDTNLHQNKTTVDLNDNLRTTVLKCFVGGMPKPEVTWYKDVEKLKTNNDQYMYTHDSQELHIKYLRETDSGKYSCHVENRIGKLSAYVDITAEEKEFPIGLIVLIVILFITIAIPVIYFTIKVRREKIMRKELMENVLIRYEKETVECVNPLSTDVDDQSKLLSYKSESQ